MKVKKILSTLVLSLLTLGLLFGCQQQKNEASTPMEKKPTVTVTTSFLQDMVKQLVGDDVKTELIIPAGEDPHLYIAKAGDLKKLKEADLVLYHGLHFEGKMVDVLEQKGQAVSKHFPKEKIGTFDEDGKVITDPHFWFDISLYKLAVEEASAELQNLLPNKATEIKSKATDYLKKLDELDAWNIEQLSQIPEERRYLITPHDAFNYFSRAYHIPVQAPQGVSTDSEVDNKAMIDTVDFIIKHNIKAIFSESTTNPERMEKLKEAVKARGGDVKVVTGEGQELFSDSLAPQGEDGDTYIDMYRHNTKLIVDNLK
ncbi:metal transporter [Granulicatella sp. zg-ZJ]|uniref:metal ABC transporter solute-binding protein, Zn/Mn family n=1 Tax=Granulicatella sp. zg-ZJ TaxID=2678504 RepID=UPI0013D8A56F|nr:zinc ABC transporter substrate-binding protein [Granulicatella sp. zg-ZJ]NEW63104.1 metal transporter [Granulicatella sp. zg-ZJ]